MFGDVGVIWGKMIVGVTIVNKISRKHSLSWRSLIKIETLMFENVTKSNKRGFLWELKNKIFARNHSFHNFGSSAQLVIMGCRGGTVYNQLFWFNIIAIPHKNQNLKRKKRPHSTSFSLQRNLYTPNWTDFRVFAGIFLLQPCGKSNLGRCDKFSSFYRFRGVTVEAWVACTQTISSRLVRLVGYVMRKMKRKTICLCTKHRQHANTFTKSKYSKK